MIADSLAIDDPFDLYSKHTLLHDAVALNRWEIFEFLLKCGANPMVRDSLGYTPLLKAAAVGNLQMVKYLVETARVDPRHVDPYGVTPREKAELYARTEIVEYLTEAEKRVKGAQMVPQLHDAFRRSGRYWTRFDY